MAATRKSAAKQASKKQAPKQQARAAKRAAKKAAPSRTSGTNRQQQRHKATAAKAAPPKPKKTEKAPAAKKAAPATKKAAAKRSTTAVAPAPDEAIAGNGIPAPRGRTKDGIAYTKDFDAKFLKSQQDLLLAERRALTGQALRLEDEANSLIEEGEMGDVQFDDESGEGDTMVVERERDLALSAQARQTIADIDAALRRLSEGSYGYSVVSGRPIPRERLEAIPWATVLVEEKVGGIGRR
jgi:RNA polymerase-binding transcription factor DksA